MDSMDSPPSADDRPPTTPGRWQFGLASLLLLMTICAVIFSFWKSLGPKKATEPRMTPSERAS